MGWWLAACLSEETSRPVKTEETPTPTAPAPTTEAPPPWTAGTTAPPALPADVDAGLNEAIAVLAELDLEPMMSVYFAIRELGDSSCPYDLYGEANIELWYANCAAPSGAAFSGFGYSYADASPNYRYWYWSLGASLSSPKGESLSADGVFESAITTTAGSEEAYLYLDGTLAYDGSLADGTWLGDGLTPAVTLYRYGGGPGTGYVSVTGLLTGVTNADAVEFSNVLFDEASGCAQPVGTVSLRTVEGDWFDVTWDRVDCDGCGEARWLGLVVGEVCADFSPWTGERLTP